MQHFLQPPRAPPLSETIMMMKSRTMILNQFLKNWLLLLLMMRTTTTKMVSRARMWIMKTIVETALVQGTTWKGVAQHPVVENMKKQQSCYDDDQYYWWMRLEVEDQEHQQLRLKIF